MTFRCIRRLILTILAVGLFAIIHASCGSPDATPRDTPVPTGLEAGGTEKQLPLRNTPVPISLPSPDELALQAATSHEASYFAADLHKAGSEFDPALPNSRVTTDGGRGEFSPDFQPGTSGIAKASYAIYPFWLADYNLASALLLRWSSPPATTTDCYIGFGNFLAGRWDWYQSTTSGVISTPGFFPYIHSASGVMLVVVVVLGQQQPQLDLLSVGSGISGKVTDTISKAPLSYVRVEVPNLNPVMTNLSGEFTLWGIDSTERLPVSFRKPGYVDTTTVYNVEPGVCAFSNVKMYPCMPRSISADDGGNLAIVLGGTMTLPPGALVNSYGTPLAGDVCGNLTFLDPTDDVHLAAIPGDFSDYTGQRLVCYGVVELHIEDGKGGDAELASDKPAHVKLLIPDPQQEHAPSIMGLYSFDKLSGCWIEVEQLLTKTADQQFYEGDVPHLGQWLCGHVYIPSCNQVKVVDSRGHPVPGVRAVARGTTYAGHDYGWTNIDGIACLEAKLNATFGLCYDASDNVSDPIALTAGGSYQRCTGEGDCELAHTFTIQFPPTGVLFASPAQGPTPLSVSLNAAGSFDRDGEIVSYEWDFDGSVGGWDWTNSSANPTIQHFYSQAGNYAATVRLTDNHGNISMASADVCVGQNGGNGGDWWMLGHDPQHTSRSSFNGPQTDNLRCCSDPAWPATPGSTPVLAVNGTIFLAVRGTGLFALDPADGATKWQAGPCEIDISATPAIGIDGMLYSGWFDGGLRAINPLTHDVEWTYWTNGAVACSPAIGPNGVLYIGSDDTLLHAVDPATGYGLWTYDVGAKLTAAPAIAPDGTVYAAVNNGRLYSISAQGNLNWWRQVAANGYDFQTRVPVVGANGMLYLAVGGPPCSRLAAFDVATGSELWEYHLEGDAFEGSPSIDADGTVYVGADYFDSGNMASLCAINGQTGAQIWRTPGLSGEIRMAPAIGADGKLYYGVGTRLRCLDPSGNEVWHYDLPASSQFTPSIAEDGTLFYACADSRLYAFADP